MLPSRFRGVVPCPPLHGDDAQDTALLEEMLADAAAYLRRQQWCASVGATYWGGGVGGVIAVFLMHVHMHPGQRRAEEWIWVVCGDVPTLYLDSDVLDEPVAVLGSYCNLLSDWAQTAKNRGDLREVVPIEAEATPENARMLETRVAFIREELLGAWPGPQEQAPGGGCGAGDGE